MHHTVCFWHQIFCFLFILVCVSCHLKGKKKAVLTKQAWEEEHIKSCSVHGSKGNVGCVGTDYHHLSRALEIFFTCHHVHEMFMVKVQPI